MKKRYNPKDPSGWPDHVKKLPAKKGRQWVHTWNGVYDDTGSEKRAFKAANAGLSKVFIVVNGRGILKYV